MCIIYTCICVFRHLKNAFCVAPRANTVSPGIVVVYMYMRRCRDFRDKFYKQTRTFGNLNLAKTHSVLRLEQIL